MPLITVLVSRRRKAALTVKKIRISMYCDAPTTAIRKQGRDPATGKHYRPWSYTQYDNDDGVVSRMTKEPAPGDENIILPCGKCMMCTLRYRKNWVVRCMHEMRYYDECCYLTLTVDDANIDAVFPPAYSYLDGKKWNSLDHKPWQDFAKRLRRQLSYGYHYDQVIDGKPVHRIYHGDQDKPLRFFMCGEYGDNTHRPHYHAIIFGYFPPDAVPLPGKPGLFISPMLQRKWPFGFHTVARVDPACVSYVAGYVDKKMDSARMAWAFEGVAPEYVAMSRGCSKLCTGGIGRSFFDDYYRDIWPMNDDGSFARDYCILGHGVRIKVPRYYDSLLELRDPERYDKLVEQRERVGAQREADFDLVEWLNESHRRNAVASARRKQREPGVTH